MQPSHLQEVVTAGKMSCGQVLTFWCAWCCHSDCMLLL